MKKITLAAAAFLLSVGVLAGCTASNQEAQAPEGEGEATPNVEVDEALQAELDAMFEANTLENIFNAHVIVNLTEETWSVEDGEEVFQYVDREFYSSAGSGITYHSETEDAAGDIAGDASYSSDVDPFVGCSSMPSIGYTALGLYPAGEYMDMVTQQWLFRDSTVLERVISVDTDEAAGNKTIVTQVVYEDSGIGIETTYFVDLATNLLTGYEKITYDVASNEPMNVSRANIWYDEPRDLLSNPVADVLGSDDPCVLTAVFNPGQADEETQTFSIAKGTSVSVATAGHYEMYNDAKCTDPCDDVATDGDTALVYVKLIG